MSIGYFQWTKIGCFRWTRSGSFRRTLTASYLSYEKSIKLNSYFLPSQVLNISYFSKKVAGLIYIISPLLLR